VGSKSATLSPALPAAEAEVPTRADVGEAQLVAEALRGERGAWAELVRRHDRRVMVALLARGVRVERARDLVQETWLRLMQQQAQGRLRELKLPGLAIAQAQFLLLDELRQRTRREDGEAPADAPGLELLASPLANPLERLVGREQLRRAEQALQDCSPSARRTFALVYDNPGLPQGEVAQRLGLSLQRVRQTLCEVRKRIRLAIEGDA
jgi:RNA polymerase sigma-70 factor (ECF subfamily)